MPNRVLIGPWSHEEDIENFTGDIDLSPALTVIRDHELAFYDRFLKDVDNGWDERPPAELYVLGANEWRGEERVAARANRSRRPSTCGQGGALSVDEPRPDEPADRYDYDPADPVPTIGGVNSVLTMTQGAQTPIRPGPVDQRALERRDDVLVYTSEPLDRDLEVIGPVEMVLYAASSAKDTDFIVRLCDVYPDGRSIFLTEGIIRARYRGSLEGESTSSCSSPARSPSTGSAAIRSRTSSGGATASGSTSRARASPASPATSTPARTSAPAPACRSPTRPCSTRAPTRRAIVLPVIPHRDPRATLPDLRGRGAAAGIAPAGGGAGAAAAARPRPRFPPTSSRRWRPCSDSR